MGRSLAFTSILAVAAVTVAVAARMAVGGADFRPAVAADRAPATPEPVLSVAGSTASADATLADWLDPAARVGDTRTPTGPLPAADDAVAAPASESVTAPAPAPVAAPTPVRTPIPQPIPVIAPTAPPIVARATPAPTLATSCPSSWFCYPRLGIAGPIVPYTDCSGSTDVGTAIRSYSCLSDHYLMGHAYTQFGLVRQWAAGDTVFAWGQRFTVSGAVTQQSCGAPSFPLATLSMQTSLTSSACGPVLVVQAR